MHDLSPESLLEHVVDSRIRVCDACGMHDSSAVLCIMYLTLLRPSEIAVRDCQVKDMHMSFQHTLMLSSVQALAE